MREPFFDWLEEEVLFLDHHVIRDQAGSIVARIRGDVVTPTRGTRWGWFADGVLCDCENRVLAYLREHAGGLPGAEHAADGFPATLIAEDLRIRKRRHAVQADRWSLHDARTYFSE